MSQEGRAKQLEETLRDLAQWAGGFERSTMYPGAEVVDDSFSAERVLVIGSEGYYEPALRMAGMAYANGDLVTILYIKGTEPIALAQGPGSPSTGLSIHDHSDATEGGQNLRAIDELEFDDASQLTIDGAGAVTRTQVYHAIETNAGGATDNLDTINGGSEGDLLIIRPYHDGHTVVVRHDVGNIWLLGGTNISLDDIGDHLALVYDGTNSQWCSIGDGGGGGAWELGNTITVGPTGDHATIAAALAAAGVGDLILIDTGTYVETGLAVPAGVSLVGVGYGGVNINSAAGATTMSLAQDNFLQDLNFTPSSNATVTILDVNGTGCIVRGCQFTHGINTAAVVYTIRFDAGTAAYLILDNLDVRTANTGAGAAYQFYGSGQATTDIMGGVWEAKLGAISWNAAANHAIRLISLPLTTSVPPSTGAGIVRGPYSTGSDVIMLGTGRAIKGYGSNYPDVGSSTDAEKFGDSYLSGFSSADSHPFVVKNTSGVVTSAGDLGYVDDAGEYKETTTAYSDIAWCVVLVGGANNADIYVARRGRVIVTLNGNCSIGDYLYTSATAGQAQPQSYVRPEIFAVALTANAGGAGGTCEALLMTGTSFSPISTNINLYTGNTAHSGSDFVSTINGAPVGAAVVYGAVTSGNEEFIEPAASLLTKMRLYNSTRSNYAKIDSVNLGTNTITVSAAADIATWQNGDSITVRSQTNTGTIGSAYYVDIEIDDSTVIPELTRAVYIGQTLRDTGGAGLRFGTMPWQAYGTGSDEANLRCQVANIPIESDGRVIPIIQRRFTLACNASGAGTINAMSSRIRGVYVAVP